jgi:hypothetical protein
MRHRCVEDDGGGGNGGREVSITRAATFSFASSSLSFEDKSLEESISVSQPPKI